MDTMKTYNVTEYPSREDLERQVETDLGKTPDKKDGRIVGTSLELSRLQLSHGQSVWGVEVVADDFIQKEKQPKPSRGILHKSSLNYSK